MNRRGVTPERKLMRKNRQVYWKGGKIYDQGYVYVLARNHPNRNKYSNRVAEHRLVMERELGRYLHYREVVHHLNGIKDDNRPENLIVTTQGKHMHDYHRIATHCKMCGKSGQMRRGYCYNHYERWRATEFAGSGPAPDKIRARNRM